MQDLVGICIENKYMFSHDDKCRSLIAHNIMCKIHCSSNCDFTIQKLVAAVFPYQNSQYNICNYMKILFFDEFSTVIVILKRYLYKKNSCMLLPSTLITMSQIELYWLANNIMFGIAFPLQSVMSVHIKWSEGVIKDIGILNTTVAIVC